MDPNRLFIAKTLFTRGWTFSAVVNHLKLTGSERSEVAEYLMDAFGRDKVFPPSPRKVHEELVPA